MVKNRKLESLHLKFFQKTPNVGDQFSLAVAQHYFSSNVISCDETALKVPNLILVGSVLEFSDSQSHICGAGFISSDSKLYTTPKSIHCVRGPLTRFLLEKQGIICPATYADPGVLAPQIYPHNNFISRKIGIIPHYVDAMSPWIESCRQKGITIIDVFSPLDKFFTEINQCEIILSTSLHGIIFAHAYGKPALWIELSDKVIGNGFKYFDYYLSVGVTPEKVKRICVKEDTDPHEIAKLATIENQSKLLISLEEAIDKTIRQLNQAQVFLNIRNAFKPPNFISNNTYFKKLKACFTD